MPIDPASIAAIASAASAIGQNGANAYAQGRMNKKMRKWNEKMYERQRADSLLDYNMQNEYNSPQSQMERLRKAGLNPNMVYNNGATHDAAPVRSTQMDAWRPQAAEFEFSGMGNALQQFMDIRLKEAQLDNLKTANTVAVQDAALRAAQVAQTVVGTKQSEFNLQQANDLKLTSLETATEQLRKLKTETNVTINADERAAAQNSQSLAEGAERILNLRLQRAKTQDERDEIKARIKHINTDRGLKEQDLQLKQDGLSPNDSTWWRILHDWIGEPLQKLKSKFKSELK